MRQCTRIWVGGVVLVATPLVFIAGCGESAESDSRAVNSERFLSADQRIVESRADNPGTIVSEMQPALTDAVDITGDGEYTFNTSPFPCEGYNANIINYNAPDDTDFNWEPSDVELVQTGNPGSCTIQFVATVSNYEREYPDFRLWVS